MANPHPLMCKLDIFVETFSSEAGYCAQAFAKHIVDFLPALTSMTLFTIFKHYVSKLICLMSFKLSS